MNAYLTPTETESLKTTEIQDVLAERLAHTPIGTAGRTFAGHWWGPAGEATRFYFGESAIIRKDGKPVRGIKVWLQFDVPSLLEGCSLRVQAPKKWYKSTLAAWHAVAFAVALEVLDPELAANFLAECEEVGDHAVGDMVRSDEDD